MHLCKSTLMNLLLVIALTETNSWKAAMAQPTTSPTRSTETVTQHRSDGQTASNDTIHLNFRDADILQIINLMSEVTGKNFLVDDQVKGKITIVAPKPVSRDEAYQVFLAILEIQGFTVVPQGPLVKIIPSRDIKQRPLPTATDPRAVSSDTSDAFVTQLIPLAFADVNDIRTLLAPLVSKESSLLAYAPTNTLILTEFAANVSRLLTIIRALDVEGPSMRLEIIPLKHALAEELASTLESALGNLAHASPQTGRGVAEGAPTPVPAQPHTPKAPTKIIADSRTNSLVVIATPDDMAVATDFIAKLDVPIPEGLGQIHVHYLDHIDAQELAAVLTAQATEIARVTSDAEGPRPGRSKAVGGGGLASSDSTPAGINITAHRPTNSLVIIASPEAYVLMKRIIDKLDVRRSQVLVESLIVEVSLDQSQSLGVEWRVIREPNGTQAFGSSLGTGEAALLNSVASNPLIGTPGLLLGVLRNSIRINGEEIFDIPALLRAFQGKTDANILANPNLLAIDNEEAQIVIGENRPFLTSVIQTPAGGVVQTTSSFEFRDTGITLRIRPKISQSGTVRLNLFIELTRFISEAETGAVTTTKRLAETEVIVDDGQTIIVGGLIQEDQEDSVTQVPCLGNLPLFAWLFKQTSARKRKTNLLIFITPHILASPDDIRRVTDHKRQQSEKPDAIEEQLRKSQPPENFEILLE